MEETILVPCVLGLLLLPILAVLMALCVHCHRLPAVSFFTSLYPRGIQIKRPYTLAPRPPTYPPVTSYPALSQPDLLPIPRSPQPPGGSHRTPSSRRDSDGANSVPSYENEGASGIRGARVGWGGWGPSWARLTPVLLPPEPACEDADEDEDEDDYRNPGYLVVLPTVPRPLALPPHQLPGSAPGLRDSAFSMESIDDYVNVPESGESAEASLDGSREYVNVSQELHPGVAKMEAATLSSQEVEEVEEEGAPDYENLQELN
uniref:Linker for activation of T cells n=1 Tax=Aotus nancymaae TaxID=37293 RepID=A0A2K5CMB8_AOTNA